MKKVISGKVVKFISVITLLLISKNSYAKEIQYKITENAGMIGCVTKETFQKAVEYSLANNVSGVQVLILSNECVFLMKDSTLYGKSGLCSKKDKPTDIFSFRLKGMAKKVFFPCAAIGVK